MRDATDRRLSRRDVLAAAAAGTLALPQRWARAAEPPLRVAFVDHRDRWTRRTGTAAWLKFAGIEPIELDPGLPADRQGVDAIVFGSFSSETAAYRLYMQRLAKSIPRFVDNGGVVLQFTQADQVESAVPFLPEGIEARRVDTDPTSVFALRPDHPLLSGLIDPAADPPRLALTPFQRPGAWEALSEHAGFAVLAAAEPSRRFPVMLEAGHGRGRFVVTALYFDRLLDDHETLDAPAPFIEQARRFADNFRRYVGDVRAGRAPAAAVDRPYTPPAPLPYTDGAWTLAVLPDTQKYCQYPQWNHHFHNQTRWLVDQAGPLHIQHALHIGDVVHTGFKHEEWKLAEPALSRALGRIPLGIVPGNHDYDDNSGPSRETFLNRYVGPARLAEGGNLVTLLEDNAIDNQALAFEVDGQRWLMLGLEYGPRDHVLAWASQVLERHADHHAVVFTHAYTYIDDTRHDWKMHGLSQRWNPIQYLGEGNANDAQMMWDKLIRRHPGVRLVVSGHMGGDGLGRLVSEADDGHRVHQVLANYQMRPEGGGGYLRLYEFQPDGRTVHTKTYSPSEDRYKTDPDNQFVLKL